MTSISFGDGNSGAQVGVNNGSIYLLEERPETPPLPLSNVPFRRDPDFVDHGSLLDQVHEKGSVPGSRIALVGLGGVGKSQLAIEYCYRIRDQSPETWVFWIHASNATRFQQSCRDIADRLKIPGRKNYQANIVKLFHDWLNDAKNGKWVLVLDNLDDDDFLYAIPTGGHDRFGSDQSGISGRSIGAYFAQSLKGFMVITSRSRHVALRTVEAGEIIPVEPMNEANAMTLFEVKLGAQANREEVAQLIAVLDYMPLAIVQAAGYIRQRAPRLSVMQYLEKFRRSDRQKVTLLEYGEGYLRRDFEAKNSILVTWHISFDHIRDKRPSAADLLSLMSFFDRQGIPDDILREDAGRSPLAREPGDTRTDSDGEESSSASSVVDRFEDDVLMLRDYSLISVSRDKRNFEMHRLVQLAMQGWLKAQKQLEKWEESYIGTLCSNFPSGVFGTWQRCELLFPHVQRIVPRRPTREPILGRWASLLHKAAVFALNRGHFVEGKRMAERAVNARKESLGSEHPVTLASVSNLAMAYASQKRWKEAEELQMQVLESQKQLLRPEHPDTLVSMGCLSATYWNQGRWDEAEGLQLQELETKKKLFGLEHPGTLTSMGNLAMTYMSQGRGKEAEEIQMQVLEIRKRVLGPDHPDTLTNMANQAGTYWDQGRWKEAEELHGQVLEVRKQVLGPEHPSTLRTMAMLASTYQKQGRLKEAEELEVQVLEIRKRVLGPDHQDTLCSMSNLASTILYQRRWKESEELQVQLLEIQKQVFGPDHPGTLVIMSNLAFTLRILRQNKPALLLMTECARLRNQKLGPDHPDTISSTSTLNEWRGMDEPSSPQSTEALTETEEEQTRTGFRAQSQSSTCILSGSVWMCRNRRSG